MPRLAPVLPGRAPRVAPEMAGLDPSSPRGFRAALAYHCEAETIPDLTPLSHHIDFFVSPPDLSWTMIYGHEVDEFGGPYFTRREWVR